MPNLLGPSVYSALRAAASRPAVTPNSTGSDTFFQDCTSPIARDGTEIRAGFLNALIEQMRFLIRAGQVTEDNTDQMTLRAVRSQRMNFAQAAAVTGTANSVALAFSPPFGSLSELFGVPIRFMPEATCTGTVTIAVDALAPVALTWADGASTAAGDVVNARMIEMIYDGSAFRMRVSSSPSKTLIANQNTSQSIASGSFNTIVWHGVAATSEYVSMNTGTGVATFLRGGTYLIEMAVPFTAAVTSGQVAIEFRKTLAGGGSFSKRVFDGAVATAYQTQGIAAVQFAPNDTLETQLFVSGGATIHNPSSVRNFLNITRIGE